MSENTNILTKKVSVGLLAAVLVYLIISVLVDQRFREIELNTREQIAEQEKTLVAIAETTARNGADKVTEQVVKDCRLIERSQFDDLLSRLDTGLSRSELIELERLFGRCGSFYAERKTVMATRLTREIEIYDDYVTQLSTIVDEDLHAKFATKKWEALAAEERKQSELFTALVQLQDEIITRLLAGAAPSSEEVQTLVGEAREARETLIVVNKQASNIRSELTSL